MASVKFLGEGSFELVDGDRKIPFCAGSVIEGISPELAEELCKRVEFDKPLFQRVDGSGQAAPAKKVKSVEGEN